MGTRLERSATVVEWLGIAGIILVVLPFLVIWGKAELGDMALEEAYQVEQAAQIVQGLEVQKAQAEQIEELQSITRGIILEIIK